MERRVSAMLRIVDYIRMKPYMFKHRGYWHCGVRAINFPWMLCGRALSMRDAYALWRCGRWVRLYP